MNTCAKNFPEKVQEFLVLYDKRLKDFKQRKKVKYTWKNL